MPLYTYTCDRHGTFSAWATLAESSRTQTCPDCDEPAPRALAAPKIGRPGRPDLGSFACDADPGMRPTGGGGCGCGAGGCVH